jgi:hypothetical protein
MAAGKSTLARLLASRFERGVHLEGDFFRRSVVSGRQEMTPDPLPKAIEQLRLRYRLAAAAADGYFAAGFTVALEDVVAGPLLGEYRTMIRSRPCHVVVLLPSVETVAAREAGREEKGYAGAWTIEGHRCDFVRETPRVGLWLDTTEQSPEQTVNEILARTTFQRSPLVVVDYDEGGRRSSKNLPPPSARWLPISERRFTTSAARPYPAWPPSRSSTSTSSFPRRRTSRSRSSGSADSATSIRGRRGSRVARLYLWPPDATPHHLYVVAAGSEPLLPISPSGTSCAAIRKSRRSTVR